MPEESGTVKQMNRSGKSWVLEEFDCVWNKGGKDYDGPALFSPGEKITMVYDEVPQAGGKSSFFVSSAWPTTGRAREEPSAPSGPPAAKSATPETNGPTLAGPPPAAPNRENSILFQVCLKAAQEWVLAVDSLAKTPAEVLHVADVYYGQGTRLINGESLEWSRIDGDPGPQEPA